MLVLSKNNMPHNSIKSKINMDQKYRCQYIILNLLKSFDESENTESSLAVRELLLETSRCDDWNGDTLKNVRTAYAGYLTRHGDEDTVKRIKTLHANDQDELLSAATVIHYDTWTQDQLLSCLTPWNRIRYQFYHKAEQTFAVLGILGVGYGTIKGVRSMSKYSLEKVRKMRKADKKLKD